MARSWIALRRALKKESAQGKRGVKTSEAPRTGRDRASAFIASVVEVAHVLDGLAAESPPKGTRTHA